VAGYKPDHPAHLSPVSSRVRGGLARTVAVAYVATRMSELVLELEE
jgi:hypothetical protein